MGVSCQNFDAVVLGGGAAGLMCAIEAGKRGRRVAILERSERVGKKILISGGGRCNFTNIYCSPENFISSNPHFAKSALARYTPTDFLALVQKHGIPYHEKTLGQLFCDRSAQDILGMLEKECHESGVQIFVNIEIQEVTRGAEFLVRGLRVNFGHRFWSWPPAAFLFQRWAPPDSGTIWRGNSGSRLARLVRRWCRSCLEPKIAHGMRTWPGFQPKLWLPLTAETSGKRC